MGKGVSGSEAKFCFVLLYNASIIEKVGLISDTTLF